MKYLNSYRFKIFISLWVFGIFLVAIYYLAGHSLVLFTNQKVNVSSFDLTKEVAHFFDYYKEHNQTSYPNSRYLKSYLDAADLPLDLRDKLVNLGIGYHFIRFTNDTDRDQAYYVAVFKQPDGPDLFYMLYDHTLYTNEYIDYQILRFPKRFSLALVIVGVLGIFAGLFVSKKLTAPINNLALQVKDLDPEQLPTNFSQKFRNDEVGILARALETSMQRIKEFIEREKNFTRDSSHELRTPVTVIKGAVELIRQLPEFGNNSIAKPINRIERSLKNMEQIIEAFLWLAREHHVKAKEESCLVGDIVRNAVEDNRYLIASKPISVDMAMDDNPRISVPESVFRIAVVNLIRNAFLYTSQGQITIIVKPNYIQITNTGTEIPPDKLRTIKEPFQKGTNSKGFGIGLAIVERLCRRFNFKLGVDSDIESNTTVKLSINA